MGKALEGIRVLDFGRAKACPTCGQTLADMGAEVIRVERPGGDFDRELAPFTTDGQSFYLAYTCRNKKSITLNLGKEKGGCFSKIKPAGMPYGMRGFESLPRRLPFFFRKEKR